MISILESLNTKATYTCGSTDLAFSGAIPNVISLIVKVIWIAVPVLLVIFGLLDLAKAVMAQKEDEIKKGQQTLIKRFIAAIIVFFVIAIVQIVIRFVSGGDETIANCFNCFVNGEVSSDGCERDTSDGGGI